MAMKTLSQRVQACCRGQGSNEAENKTRRHVKSAEYIKRPCSPTLTSRDLFTCWSPLYCHALGPGWLSTPCKSFLNLWSCFAEVLVLSLRDFYVSVAVPCSLKLPYRTNNARIENAVLLSRPESLRNHSEATQSIAYLVFTCQKPCFKHDVVGYCPLALERVCMSVSISLFSLSPVSISTCISISNYPFIR